MGAHLEDLSMSAPAVTAPAVIARPLATRPVLHVLGQQAVPMLTAEDTDGALSLMMYVAAPGDGPPPHRHREQVETFITIDEGFEFLAGNTWHAVPPHTVVHIPAGARHTFRNAASTPARTWVLTRPGNFELFLRDLADAAADAERRGTALDMARVAAIYDAYGVEAMP
jgi:quercetin dioxygenase-like cupin family protein